eukprot:gnl/TRDRNA2_/TRDRNA2_190453_c0_seq1.p1 gnl/TRDRNA2_/TRDRNA2_190453_c0~~gnl/TRDRNA2_/TRDRNA2_190453_c0_seq1.p1  ORF type:complete len:381 (-),score=89.86 gnl/TRDRNA2_/TRDRNA2_190453_c0_seq1:57-1199(-)
MLEQDELSRAFCLYRAARHARSEKSNGAVQGGIKREEYASATFWDDRFKESDGSFDWYATYEELGDTFREFLPVSPDLGETLMVGCGNSEFSKQLQDAGYRGIVNIDISPSVISKMEKRFKDLGQEWHVMSALDMTFEDGRFDIAIDKGTVDAMMCGTDETEAGKLSAEVWRTLQMGGHFVLVSHSGARRGLLERGVRAQHGALAGWELVEARKCRLSPQSTLINVLRSKLGGRPMSDAFKNPEMLKEAVLETRAAVSRMQFIDAFRMFKARKAQRAALAGEEARKDEDSKAEDRVPTPATDKEEQVAPKSAASAATNGEPKIEADTEAEAIAEGAATIAAAGDAQQLHSDEGSAAVADPRKQPFCWVYVLKKRVKPEKS